MSVTRTVVAAGALFALVAGCQKPSPAPAPAAADSAQAARRPASGDDRYHAAIALVGACKAGQTCSAEVTLEPVGELHVNGEYPFKFKVAEPLPANVKFPKVEIGRADGTFAPKRAAMKLAFVPERAGDVRLAGVLSLSVCSDANCFMDKAPLETVAKVE